MYCYKKERAQTSHFCVLFLRAYLNWISAFNLVHHGRQNHGAVGARVEVKRDRKKRCGAAATTQKSVLHYINHANEPMRRVGLLWVLPKQKENCRAVGCGNAAGEAKLESESKEK